MLSILALVLGLYLWMFLHIALHETGHVLAAKAVGFSPVSLTVGKGPFFFRRRIGNLQVQVHLIPSGGRVHARLVLKGLRWKGAVFAAAGLLVDTLLLLVFLSLAGFRWGGVPQVSEGSFATQVFAILAFYQAFMVALSLVPMQVSMEGVQTPNDGRQVVDYLRGRTSRALSDYERGVATYDPQFRLADSWVIGGDPSMWLLASAAEQDMVAGRYAEATEKYLRLIATGAMHPGEKALLLDRVACIPIYHGEKSFLERAEASARQASGLVPGCKTVRGTLGAILVEKGECADGLALLMPLTSEDNSPVDRALASCYVAKAFHFLGKPKEAAQWLSSARSCGVFPAIVSRVEAELT